MKKKLKNFKAVFFDMDGVIVDSMPYHFISWFEALRKHNVRIAPADIFAMEGAKWDKVIRYTFKRDGLKFTKQTAHKIFLEKQRIFIKYFKRYVFNEIIELITLLKKQGFFTGLVTGSSLMEAKKMLPKNVYSLFDVKVGGDMVKRGKPYPDSYLLAAKTLNLSPKECIVIENAPYGIKAANAAKMYSIAIATSLSKKYLKNAKKVYSTHKELFDYFKK
jgi:beta-phosphoglucomutase